MGKIDVGALATTTEVERFLQQMRANPLPAWERMFTIVPKDVAQGLTTLKLNTVQQALHNALESQRLSEQPQRAIVYKARQTGISTYMEAKLASRSLTHPYSSSLIVAQVDFAVQGLSEKVNLIMDNLPPKLRPVGPPSRKDKLTFAGIPCVDGYVPLHSRIETAKSGGKPRWRSMTVQACHLSELAFYGDASIVLDGLLQAIPRTPDSLVVIESTAFGASGTFYEEWQRARNGESDFQPIFIPWHQMHEYQMPVTDKPFVKDEDERILVEAFGVTREQLQWRRWCIRNNCRGDKDKFKQEYPATEDDGFWLTGRPAFPVDVLREMLNQAVAHPPRLVGYLDLEHHRPERGERGPYREWLEPESGHDYVVSGDAAAGTKDGDYCAAIVFDRMRQTVVASWHGKVTPAEFGMILLTLCKRFNKAILAPEANNHGLAVIEALKNQMYDRWYFWNRVDKATHAQSRYLGWETSYKTRQLMVDTMRWALVAHEINVLDPDVIRELLEFEYIAGDDLHPEGRFHDDLAMAAMIALRVHFEMPMITTGVPPKLMLPDLPQANQAPEPTPGLSPMHASVWETVMAEQQGMAEESGTGWQQWDVAETPGLDEAPDMPW